MSFETLLGNKEVKQTLKDIANNKNALHSYIFYGQEGIGKKEFAKEFAKMILCKASNKEECGSCESCVKFNSNNHPDYTEVEPDGNSIKIAQMRNLQEKIYIKPIVSDKKIFVINDADKMTEEAQNSLLKTLEEPPEYIIIILIVSNENLLLNTIKSRCTKIKFQNINREDITKYIKENNIIENPSDNIIDICNGSIGKAEKVKKNIEKYTEIERIFDIIFLNKNTSIIDLYKNSEVLYKSKDNIIELLQYMIVVVYNKAKNKYLIKENTSKILNIIKIIENAKIKLYANCNYDMCIDEMLFSILEEIN